MSISLQATLEATLFAAGEPVAKKRLTSLLEVSPEALREAAVALHDSLSNRGLAIVETDTELELRTAPATADTIQKLRESELSRDLGKAGLETIAVILYQNGATRGHIDWIRGVNSAAAIRTLLLRGLIERVEDPNDKRRARYRATIDALAHLGVSRREDLPRYEEFAAALAAHQPSEQPTE